MLPQQNKLQQWIVAPVIQEGDQLGWVVLSFDWQTASEDTLLQLTKEQKSQGSTAILDALITDIALACKAISQRVALGVLVAADEQRATIRLEDPTADGTFPERVVSYDQIDRARTVFVWGPAPKQPVKRKKEETP